MNLPAICIRRPALTIVISLVMMIIGLIGFINLPVRWIPNVNPPRVNIMTNYPGANPSTVEHDVTKIIESALSGISGIDTLSSVTSRDESQIMITFQLGKNSDAAVEDIRAAIERIRDELPKEAKTPAVVKADPNNRPILYLSFFDAKRNARELSDYVDKYILPAFETIDGVGRIQMLGKRVSAMRIWLDPNKMAGAHVTVDEVTNLLQAQNASIPSGQIRSQDRFYNVITDTSLKTPNQFNELILRKNAEHIIRLKDIGTAEFAAEDTDTLFRVNGQAAVALGIIPQSMANPLDIEQRVQKVLAETKRSLPQGMEANLVFNQADYIRASIHSVYQSLLEAVFFVWLVIFVFLCNFRATFIPIITIPVCLISSFSLLYFLGFSINTITLMAFVLAIGLVVDDAIVMLENISRHREAGASAFNAALIGSKEMIFPVIAMTITLTAVYAPIAFTKGLLGILFREFTFTLAGTVLISGIVALTLTPMMCARFLPKSSTTSPAYAQWIQQRFQRLQNFYQRALMAILKRRHSVLAALIVIGAMGSCIYAYLPAELAPSEDMDQIYVFVSSPNSASTAYTDAYVHQLETLYSHVPEISSQLTMMFSPSQAFQILKLTAKKNRKLSTKEIVDLLNSKVKRITGVQVNVFTPSPPLLEFTNNEGDNFWLSIMTTKDYRELHQSSQRMMNAAKKMPDFTHVENTLKWDSTHFQVNIDRERAADLKVSIPSITNTISTLIAGKNVGKTDEANILVQMQQASLGNPNIFHDLYVRNTDEQMLPLASMVTVQEVTSPIVFQHTERLRADTIYFTLAGKTKISDAVHTLEKIAKEILPDDMKFTFTGEAKSFLDSIGRTIFTFSLALIFIYLVLVAQFESFIDPLIIMTTVPFAIAGALLTLKIFGGSLNIYSNIGLITLIGLIAKHGILITEFANQLQRKGQSLETAIITAAQLRLRPILMTTAAMVLGAIPLAMASGPGAECRQQIGLVISGGLLLGTFFSLIVIPVIYTYLSPWHHWRTETEELIA